MFSSLSECSWLADQAAPGPAHLGTDSDTRPFLDGDDFRAGGDSKHLLKKESMCAIENCYIIIQRDEKT